MKLEKRIDKDGVETEGPATNMLDGMVTAFLTDMREKYERGIEQDHDREEAHDDLVFGVLGKQWREDVQAEREKDKQPVLTINKLPERVEQITGTQRKRNMTIKVRAVDDDSDVKKAEVINGLFKNIAHNSAASTAFDEAFDSSVWCGRGFIRILTEYADDDVFEQDIKIESIQERFSVVLDPAGVRYDRSDGNWCFIEQKMQRADFEREYPDMPLIDWDTGSNELGWLTDDEIRVVEFFWKVPVHGKLYMLEDGSVVKELPEGVTPIKERAVLTNKVMWVKATGSHILDGLPADEEGEIGREFPGKYIPIVPVWGKSITVDSVQQSRGAVRFAKEPCRMYNYWRSEEYAYLQQQPKSPYIITAKQLGAYKEVWDNAHKKAFPYLPIAEDKEAKGVPQRQFPPSGPSAFGTQAQISHQEINATVGIHQESMGDTDAQKSGRAIGLLQEKGDTGSFQFGDNLVKSSEYAGKIIMGMIPYIYDTERIVRIMNEDGSTRSVKLNTRDDKGNPLNDVTTGKYDVYMDTGKDYLTARMESQDFWMQMMQTMPETGRVLADIMIRNADVKGAKEAEERLRKTLPPGMITEPREGEELPQPQHDPTLEFKQKLVVLEVAKAEAELEQLQKKNAGLDKENHKKDLEAEAVRIEIVEKIANNPRVESAVTRTLMEGR